MVPNDHFRYLDLIFQENDFENITYKLNRTIKWTVEFHAVGKYQKVEPSFIGCCETSNVLYIIKSQTS